MACTPKPYPPFNTTREEARRVRQAHRNGRKARTAQRLAAGEPNSENTKEGSG